MAQLNWDTGDFIKLHSNLFIKLTHYILFFTILLNLLSGVGLAQSDITVPPSQSGEAYDGWIVKLSSDRTPLSIMKAGSEQNRPTDEGLLLVESIDEAKKYLDNGLAEYAEPNYTVQLQDLFSTGSGWAYSAMHGDYAKGLGLTGKNIRIAIIDSGLDRTADLAGANIGTGRDYTGSISDTSDSSSNKHGTTVAAMIAGGCGDGIGVDGLAPEAVIIPLKCFTSSGASNIAWLADAINYAVTLGCDVINMSWGLSSYSRTLHTAIQNAYNAGVVLVAAAGNISSSFPANTLLFPAAWDEVIGVGAVDNNLNVAAYSQQTSAVYVCAPGTYVYGTDYSGTSFASPCVAAAAALLLQYRPSLTNNETALLLKEKAVDLGLSGYDTAYGYGFVSLDRCLDIGSGFVLLNSNIGPSAATLSFIKPPDAGIFVFAAAYSAEGRMLACEAVGKSAELRLSAENIKSVKIFIIDQANGYAPAGEFIEIT